MAIRDTTRLDEKPESPTTRRDGPNVPTGEVARSPSEFSGGELVVGYPASDEPILDGESIHVPPGEVTALVGPNGCGKSTLLKGLANQLSLDDGTVLLDGEDIHSLTTRTSLANSASSPRRTFRRAVSPSKTSSNTAAIRIEDFSR
jgi:iron complex transport system ATP-binding protein